MAFLISGLVHSGSMYTPPQTKICISDMAGTNDDWVSPPVVIDLADGAAIAAHFRDHPNDWDGRIGGLIRQYCDGMHVGCGKFRVRIEKLKRVDAEFQRHAWEEGRPTGPYTVKRETYDFAGTVLTHEYRDYADTSSPE